MSQVNRTPWMMKSIMSPFGVSPWCELELRCILGSAHFNNRLVLDRLLFLFTSESAILTSGREYNFYPTITIQVTTLTPVSQLGVLECILRLKPMSLSGDVLYYISLHYASSI